MKPLLVGVWGRAMCVLTAAAARDAAVRATCCGTPRRRARWRAGRGARAGWRNRLAAARTGVGTRARAFSAGGGAHGGTAGVNTAPRGLACVRGGPRGQRGLPSPHALFPFLRARRAGRRLIWRAGGTARAVLLLWAGRCVRAFVCARKRGCFMVKPKSYRSLFWGGEVEGAAPYSSRERSQAVQNAPQATRRTKFHQL